VEGTRRPVSETAAWTCLVANLLMWPGLGCVLLRRPVGVAQMLASLAGGVWFLIPAFQLIADAFSSEPEGPSPFFRPMLAGLGVFAAAWLWSAVSSAWILRESQAAESSPKGGGPRPA
jgi:hypothetical protein